MNEEDSEQMGLYLQQLGFRPTLDSSSAHVILLNTCSVRKKPEDKAFSLLGEFAMLKARRPEIVLGVCGCMAQLRADEIRKRAPHVDFVVGTAQISTIPGLVEEALQLRKFAKRTHIPERKGTVVTDIPQRKVDRVTKLKAFVPIQYGCDKFCTFCIVPTTRGRERSRPTADIVEEVTQLVERGTREITLLGQTVNSYGKNLAEGRVPFSQLLWQLSEISGLKRLRYTSPYPRDFKTDLITTIRDCPAVMEHVHLPLQSGSDEILRSMKRIYTRESFLEIVREVREAAPTMGLTTDIIVGFPGETEDHFQETLDMVERVRFDGAYMFIYSPRPGTPAGEMEQVPYEIRHKRLGHLMAVQKQISLESSESVIGREFEILVEGRSQRNPEMARGYSRDYRMIHFPAGADLDASIGRTALVRAEKGFVWGCSAEFLDWLD